MNNIYSLKSALKQVKELKEENKQLRDFVENWYDTIKELCDCCNEDTSYSNYWDDYKEVVSNE